MFHLRPHDVLVSTLLRTSQSPLMQMDTTTKTRSKLTLWSLFISETWSPCTVTFVCFRKRKSRSRSRSPGSRKRRSKSRDKKKGKKESRSRERRRSRSKERHRSRSRSKDRSAKYKPRRSPMYVTLVKLKALTVNLLGVSAEFTGLFKVSYMLLKSKLKALITVQNLYLHCFLIPAR